jgi:hypothetical protein
MEKAITCTALRQFILNCREQKWQEQNIVDQLFLFANGTRDWKLADNCIQLLDGTITIKRPA